MIIDFKPRVVCVEKHGTKIIHLKNAEGDMDPVEIPISMWVHVDKQGEVELSGCGIAKARFKNLDECYNVFLSPIPMIRLEYESAELLSKALHELGHGA